MNIRFARNIFNFALTDILNEYHTHTKTHVADKGKVVLIASYPRSGNTYLRLLLATNYHYNMTGELTKLPIKGCTPSVETYIPATQCCHTQTNFVTESWFMKTHSYLALGYKQAILLVRPPINTIASCLAFPHLSSDNIDRSAILNYLYYTYTLYHNLWLRKAHSMKDASVIRFEDLINNTLSVLCYLFDKYGITYDVAVLRDIMALYTVHDVTPKKQHQTAVDNVAYVESSNFFSRGKSTAQRAYDTLMQHAVVF
jgi:hypothetical protein